MSGSNLTVNETRKLARDCARLARAWGGLGNGRLTEWFEGAARYLDDEVIGGGA